jgi:hypothetical protein
VRRLLLLAVGLAVGALVVRRLSGPGLGRSPKALTEAAGAALARLTSAWHGFATDVREGMVEHEAALREAAELDGGRLGPTTTP